jgi:hypothetical protein
MTAPRAPQIWFPLSVPTPDPAVRTGIKSLLQSSPAFNALPVATQQQVARDTALIADYLARPEGIPREHAARRCR